MTPNARIKLIKLNMYNMLPVVLNADDDSTVT